MSCRRWHRLSVGVTTQDVCLVVSTLKKRTSGAFLATLLLICVRPPLVPPLYLHPSPLSSRCSSSDALTYFHRIIIASVVIIVLFLCI